MTIEVKQMLIKSTVVPSRDANGVGRGRSVDEITEGILAECKQLITEILRAEQER